MRDLNPYFLLVRQLLWYSIGTPLVSTTYSCLDGVDLSEVCALVKFSEKSLTGSRGSAVLPMLP